MVGLIAQYIMENFPILHERVANEIWSVVDVENLSLRKQLPVMGVGFYSSERDV